MDVNVTNEKTDCEKSAAELYEEADHWHVNTGGEIIHAKRMGGKFRNLKLKAAATWLIFFYWPLSSLGWFTGRII